MKPDEKNELNHLEKNLRGFASRHQSIPETPRDTMAVLMQEAERQQEQSASRFPVFGWSVAFAALVILLIAGWMTLIGPRSIITPVATNDSAIETPDPGLDLAEWDMEIESLMNDVDTSIGSLTSEDSYLDSLANEAVRNGGT